jgi:hypothetical protein
MPAARFIRGRLFERGVRGTKERLAAEGRRLCHIAVLD